MLTDILDYPAHSRVLGIIAREATPGYKVENFKYCAGGNRSFGVAVAFRIRRQSGKSAVQTDLLC